MAFRDEARAALRAFPHVAIGDAPGVRRAAVAVCVLGRAPAAGVVVIRRALRGRNAGQWALPGGRLENGETAEEAVLRELREEVGLAASSAHVVGRLDDFPAASGFTITPFVVVPEGDGPLRPDPAEVHSAHVVGLDRLAGDVGHWVARPDGAPLFQLRLGPGMTVHAPTGALLWQFREVVLFGRPTRVAAFRQPDWTRH